MSLMNESADALNREHSDEEAFDDSIRILLELPLDRLRMKEQDWEKFDKPSPPNNPYVYAVQALGDVRGKKILDYGCGDGYLSIILAKRGARLWGFDVSGQSVDVGRRRSQANGTEASVTFDKMSCYDLGYGDGMFDLIIGLGVLHHIEIDQAAGEIARVLKVDGRAVFEEPFVNSAALRFLRKMIPVKADAHQGSLERPLNYEDVRTLAKPFRRLKYREFQLFSRLGRIVPGRTPSRWLNIMDQWLFDSFPFLRRFGGTIVIELTK